MGCTTIISYEMVFDAPRQLNTIMFHLQGLLGIDSQAIRSRHPDDSTGSSGLEFLVFPESKVWNCYEEQSYHDHIANQQNRAFSHFCRSLQQRSSYLFPPAHRRQQAPLHYEKAGMVLQFLAGVDELNVVPPQDFRNDLVHFEQCEMSTDANV